MTRDADVEGDPVLIAMARALHSHLPEDQQPCARMDFSDEQWARLKAARDVILRAPAVLLLKALAAHLWAGVAPPDSALVDGREPFTAEEGAAGVQTSRAGRPAPGRTANE